MNGSEPVELPGIPMTVVGGYLGSGKTTVINRLLNSASGLRIAVVVNDFGSIPIDSTLMSTRSAAVLELSNGCVCCDLSEGMSAVLDQIRALPERPDHVIVEVSGVGDPASVAQWGDYPGFRRHGVVVCADASTVQDRAFGRWSADTVQGQLRGADVLLVTKSDLVSTESEEAVRWWLGSVAEQVPILQSTLQLADLLVEPLSATRTGHNACESWSASTDTVVSMRLVRGFLEALPSEVVRAKGVLRTGERPNRRTVVHLVARRIDTYDDGCWRSQDHSELVLIAAGAPPQKIDVERDLRAALGL